MRFIKHKGVHIMSKDYVVNAGLGNEVVLDDLDKDQLLTIIHNMEVDLESNEQLILDLQVKLESRSSNEGRKQQVLEILKTNGPSTIKDIAQKLGISTKNVSSQLTYLRTDGYQIFTDNNGKKFIFDDHGMIATPKDDDDSSTE